MEVDKGEKANFLLFSKESLPSSSWPGYWQETWKTKTKRTQKNQKPYLSNVVTVIVKTEAARVRLATKLFTLHLERLRENESNEEIWLVCRLECGDLNLIKKFDRIEQNRDERAISYQIIPKGQWLLSFGCHEDATRMPGRCQENEEMKNALSALCKIILPKWAAPIKRLMSEFKLSGNRQLDAVY